jgi:hypothetical protein
VINARLNQSVLVCILDFCIKFHQSFSDESKTYRVKAITDWHGVKDVSVNYNFHITWTELAARASV